MRILIIEDDREAASYLVKAFREAGHVADHAADGLDGYAMADGPAAKAGVKTGDTIIAADGQPINEAKDLSRKVANVAPGKSLSLTLWRDGKERNVTLEVASQPKGV